MASSTMALTYIQEVVTHALHCRGEGVDAMC